MEEVIAEKEQTGVVLDHDHPWPGLVSFTEANQSFFFGREREVNELARLVRQETLTVFFGKSGLGKSSILRAGLAPLLRESEFIPIYIRLNHAEAAPPLEDQVEIAIEEVFEQEQIDGPKPIRSESLWEFFHKKNSDWWDAENRLIKPVLIFDQFEELMTVGQENAVRAGRTASFLCELEDLVENRPPVSLVARFKEERDLADQYDHRRSDFRVILTLREDFLADLEGLRERLSAVMLNRLRLLPMNGEQALAVILKPGRDLVDEDVAIQIVDFVSSSERSRLQAEVSRVQVAKRAIEPALLSVVLQELNTRRIQAGQDKITAELVGKTNPIEIFHDFYMRGLQGMDGAVREFIEDSLLTSSGARNRIAEEDALTRRGISGDVVSKLIDRRIIQRETTGNTKWLELTHDTLADVVRTDRAEHHQLRELELAAAREAEVRRKLSRARAVVAGFAVLLLFAIYEVFDAHQQRTGLRRSTENQDDIIANQLSDELSHPIAGGPERLASYIDRLDQDNRRFNTSELQGIYARALTYAAEISYFHGNVTRGLNYARRAADLANKVKSSSVPGRDIREVRAAAEYVLGRGNLESGLIDNAESHFQAALNLIGSDSKISEELARVQIMTELGLGEAKLDRNLPAEAKDIYDKVLNQLESPGFAQNFDVNFYYILTHLKLGEAEPDDRTASKQFEKAELGLHDAMDNSQSIKYDSKRQVNLAWRRLKARLVGSQASVALNYALYSEKLHRVDEAMRQAEELNKLDSQNLDWASLLARAKIMKGILEASSAAVGANSKFYSNRAREFYKAGFDQSEEIRKQDAGLVKSEYLAAVSCANLAENEQDKTESVKMLRQSRDRFEQLVKRAPGFAEYDRAAALSAGKIGIAHESMGMPEEALKDYREALQLVEKLPNNVKQAQAFQDNIGWFTERAGATALQSNDAATRAEGALLLARAREIRTRSASTNSSPEGVLTLAKSHASAGEGYLKSEQIDKAFESYRLALSTYNDGLAQFPDNMQLLLGKANLLWYECAKYREKSNVPAAIDSFRLASEVMKGAFEVDSMNIDVHKLLDGLVKDGTKFRDSLKDVELDEKERLKFASIIEASIRQVDPATLFRPANDQHWVLAPLVRGSWRVLAPEEEESERDYLLRSKAGVGLSKHSILRIRSLALSFYPDTTLLEAQVTQDDGSVGILTYMRRGGRETPLEDYSSLSDDELLKLWNSGASADAVRLDGRVLPIFFFNRKHPPLLDTRSRAQDYLWFVCGAIGGENEGKMSTVRLIDRAEDLHWKRYTSDDLRRLVQAKILPLTMKETENGWVGKGTIAVAGRLHYMSFRLIAGGTLDLGGETPLFGFELPVIDEQFSKGLRTVSDRDTELIDLIERAHQNKDWAKAVALYTERLNLIEKTGTKGQRKGDLPGLYLGLSWCQLVLKDFAGALASAEAGRKIDSDYLLLETNRAHALLFLGRTGEAEEIYRKYIGRKVEEFGRTWEDEILNDFEKLEKNDITHPEFDHIRKILKSAQH